MLRPVLGIAEPDLERALLRKGMTERASGVVQCVDCGRHPLIGETVHRYDSGPVCALCRTSHREAPLRAELVHHVEHGVSVRRYGMPRAA